MIPPCIHALGIVMPRQGRMCHCSAGRLGAEAMPLAGRTVQSVPQGKRSMGKTIAVLGAGNAGTTFALLATHNANEVRLWTIEEDVADAMRQHRENRKYLPGVTLPAEIAIEADLQKAVAGADIVMLAVPSHIVRRLTRAIAPFLMADQIILDVAKGIEEKTFYLMSEVIHSELSGAVRHNIVAL